MSDLSGFCDKEFRLWPFPIVLGWWGLQLKMFDIRFMPPLPPWQFTVDFRRLWGFLLPSGLMLITARRQIAFNYPYCLKDGRAKMCHWKRTEPADDV